MKQTATELCVVCRSLTARLLAYRNC